MIYLVVALGRLAGIYAGQKSVSGQPAGDAANLFACDDAIRFSV
jgi:hypothetical protein